MSEQQLPEGWQMVKFGDIAKHISKRVEPTETDLEIYVGLEHLDPDSLKIKRHGVPSDVAGQKLLVKKGQIIFGKRRAYQRKVAVADWDCICSAHAMVLEAKPKNVIPEFLPFFMQSDVFMNRAVSISEGSLSPTIKWKVLENQKFKLPPIDMQSKIVDLFEVASSAKRKKQYLIESSEILFRSVLNDTIWKLQSSASWKEYKISELGNIKLGRQRTPKYTTGKYFHPYLRVVNVLDGELCFDDVQEMDFDDRDFKAHKLEFGDVLVTEGDITSVFNVGRSAIFRGEIENCCIQNTLIRFRAGRLILPEFANYLFRVAFYKGVFARAANMTTVAHLGADRFGKIRLSVPNVEIQKTIVEKLRVLESYITALKGSVETYDSRVLSALMSRAFGE